jgi:hypothetical protein
MYSWLHACAGVRRYRETTMRGSTRNGWFMGALFALALCASHGMPVYAASDGGVGVVAGYRPSAARFTFVRANRDQPVPVQIGAVVMAGDRITLSGGDVVTVQLSNGKSANFSGPGTFMVPDARPLGQLAVILQSLTALVDDEYRLAGTAASRGGEGCGQDGQAVKPIAVPILLPGARVQAGTRDIPLGWRGGCPPFIVAVHDDGRKLVHRESIAGWQVRLDQVPLPVGRYQVVITDAGGRQFEGSLEAMPATPTLPPELASDAGNLGIIAQAAWLAEQDAGRWRLDSFERLRPLIRAGDPLAGSFGDALLWAPAPPATH